MKYKIISLIVLMLAATSLNAQQPKRGIALVVTNTAYKADDRLPFDDGNAIVERLKATGFDVMTSTNTKGSELRTTVKFFSDRAKKYETALFYYTGHTTAITTVGETDNYMVPVDVTLADVSNHPENCVSFSSLVEQLNQSGSKCKMKMLFINGNHDRQHRVIATDYPEIWIIYSLNPYRDEMLQSVFARSFLQATITPGLDINDIGMQINKTMQVLSDGEAKSAVYSATSGDFFFYPTDTPSDDPTTVETADIKTIETLPFNELTKLAKKGNAEAQFQLGLCYDNGIGTKMDKKEALNWFEQAARQGHAEAANNAGEHYITGEGVQKSNRAALAFFQYAADMGSSQALVNLAKHHWKYKDKQQEMDYLLRAAALGNGDAYYELGNFKKSSERIEAIALYARGAELGSAKALFKLGTIEESQGNCEKALEYYEKAAEKHLIEAIINTAILYIEKCPSQHDDKKGLALLQTAIELESPEAYSLMGYIYENGLCGYKTDKDKAIEWYIKAYQSNRHVYATKRLHALNVPSSKYKK